MKTLNVFAYLTRWSHARRYAAHPGARAMYRALTGRALRPFEDYIVPVFPNR